MSSSFFYNAHRFIIRGGEFNHINGDQTRSSFNVTDSYNIGSCGSIEGSFNIDGPYDRSLGSRVPAESSSRHRDNQASAQEYRDDRRTTNAAETHVSPIYTRGFRTPGTRERRGPYYLPQQEKPPHHFPQRTRTQYLPPAFSNSDLGLSEDAPRRRQYRYSAHNAQTATSKLKPSSRYESHPATNGNEARFIPPPAWSRNTPAQGATPHTQYSPAAQQQPRSGEEELVASQRDCYRDEVIQRPFVQATKRWAQEWEQDLFDCSRTRSVTPYRTPSKNSRSESIDNIPLPLASVSYISPPTEAGHVRQDLTPVGLAPRRRVAVIDFHLRRFPGGKQTTAKYRHRYEEAKRKNVWGHHPLKSRMLRQ
ncbi:hypothetical protein PQX77_008719 [Marasmius sp. AFHP31]|nr:hypothetical protein PQX77_008719 [Marasmius sp. AFHP31]